MDDARDRSYALVAIVGAVTALRVAGLLITPVELHGDEAQYWAWSRELAWGYYSKPPLIAWVIAATTALFGEAEWAVRLAAPLAHGACALVLGALAREMYGARAALWAGLLYLIMPAVWLSSGVMSTDALLLPLTATSIYALWMLRQTRALKWGIMLGVAAGLGFLAKYAMIYFVAGAGLLALIDKPTRGALLRLGGLVAVLTAAAIAAPNILWNAGHDFATVSHTAANANWGGSLFNFAELGDFLAAQLGVFGPISFGLLIAALICWRGLEPEARRRRLFLAAFVLPPLLIVTVQAFISRAHGNWAAAAYPAACVLVAGWLERGPFLRRGFGVAALATHAVAGAVFVAAVLSPGLADAMGLANAFKRARGWEQTAREVQAVYEAGWNGEDYVAVAADNRLLFYELGYYLREAPPPLRMWLRYAHADNHAELDAPLAPPVEGPVLVINERVRERTRIFADFAEMETAARLSIPLGGDRVRALELLAGEGFAPLARDDAYEDLFDDPS